MNRHRSWQRPATAITLLALLAASCSSVSPDTSVNPTGSVGEEPQQERTVYWLASSEFDSFLEDVFSVNVRDRSYSSLGSARTVGFLDAFTGSILVGAAIGGVASIFAKEGDKMDSFAKWGLGSAAIYLPVMTVDAWLSTEPRTEIRYDGVWVKPSDRGLVRYESRWVDPQKRGLEMVDGRWVDLEAMAWQDALMSGTPSAFVEYLRKHSDGKNVSEGCARLTGAALLSGRPDAITEAMMNPYLASGVRTEIALTLGAVENKETAALLLYDALLPSPGTACDPEVQSAGVKALLDIGPPGSPFVARLARASAVMVSEESGKAALLHAGNRAQQCAASLGAAVREELGSHPLTADTLHRLGVDFAHNDLPEAGALLVRAVDANPAAADPRYDLGVYYFEHGEYVHALEQWELLRSTVPDYEGLDSSIAVARSKLE